MSAELRHELDAALDLLPAHLAGLGFPELAEALRSLYDLPGRARELGFNALARALEEAPDDWARATRMMARDLSVMVGEEAHKLAAIASALPGGDSGSDAELERIRARGAAHDPRFQRASQALGFSTIASDSVWIALGTPPPTLTRELALEIAAREVRFLRAYLGGKLESAPALAK